jgi:hypothetical protein
MRFASVVYLGFCAAAALVACGNSGSTGVDTGSSTDGSPPSSDCSCDVTSNGESGTVECGAAGCVGGASYECDSQANLAMAGTACTTPRPAADAGSSDASDAAPAPHSGGGTKGEVAWGGACTQDGDCAPGPAGAAAEPGSCGTDSTGASRCVFLTNDSDDCPSGSVFREIPGQDGYGVCGFPAM